MTQGMFMPEDARKGEYQFGTFLTHCLPNSVYSDIGADELTEAHHIGSHVLGSYPARTYLSQSSEHLAGYVNTLYTYFCLY